MSPLQRKVLTQQIITFAWKKLPLVAQFLDKLEEDFKEVYPDLESPMPGGYEGALKRLLGEKYGDNDKNKI